MALSLAKAAPLKPEIKLAQALSEFQAILNDDQKTKLRNYRGQSPPSSTDVMKFTAEIDWHASRNRKSRRCVGTRLTNVLHAVQQFSNVVDVVVGSSQSHIAGLIWGTVKLSLQLASAISSYFDQLSILFMKIGLTCPRNQDFGLLYPESTRLQSALCEYFVVIVRLCKQAVLFLKKPFWSQLSSSILKPFESEFGRYQQDLDMLANTIREEVLLASSQAQQNEAKHMSRFRALSKTLSDNSARDLADARTRKRKKAALRFLNTCSVYNHEKSWKQARKQGNSDWICHDEGYKEWKQAKISGTLWCTGILGSGKTVLSANLVEDLRITTSATVSYFFCRHDEAKSLETRTIIGSIAKQLFDHVMPEIVDAIAEMRPEKIDTNQILDYIEELLPSNSQKYFIIIDGMDECEEKERRLLLQCLKHLLVSRNVFQIYCSSRPDVFRWAHTLLEPRWNVSMSQTSSDIEEYINNALVEHLESGSLSIGNSEIILTIQDTLLQNAHGMFLWVAFQIDSICSQKTDEAILAALGDLPKDLPETFNRVLRKLQHPNAAHPQFGKVIFDLVAAARRPLTLEELREAISIVPGETSWDASKLVNDMLRSLIDSCGSLVAIDEEHLTVHFTHHSVKQHLLSEPTDSDIRKYHINLREADLYLGDVVVTYLNLGIFDRQLARATPEMVPQENNYPSAILDKSLPQSNIANRLAVRLLKRRQNFRLDIPGQLKSATEIVIGPKEEFNQQEQQSHPFLSYAQEYWLFHTKEFGLDRTTGYTLWRRLLDEEVKTIDLPWAPKRWRDFEDDYMFWILKNEHWALINRTLLKLAVQFRSPFDNYRATNLVLEFIEKRTQDGDFQKLCFEIALYLAVLLNNKAVVLRLLKDWVDINAVIAVNGFYFTALEVASINGHEEMARLLLENGADVNTEGGFDQTSALRAASEKGHHEVVRLLLENGANVNAESGSDHTTALHAASKNGHRETVKLLLENGGSVNAETGHDHISALQAASEKGHPKVVRVLLKNGADVNAQGGFGTALQIAAESGHHEVVRLLVENGADINAKNKHYHTSALEASSQNGHQKVVRYLLDNGAIANDESRDSASKSGNRKIQKLILNALPVDQEENRCREADYERKRTANEEKA